MLTRLFLMLVFAPMWGLASILFIGLAVDVAGGPSFVIWPVWLAWMGLSAFLIMKVAKHF